MHCASLPVSSSMKLWAFWLPEATWDKFTKLSTSSSAPFSSFPQKSGLKERWAWIPRGGWIKLDKRKNLFPGLELCWEWLIDRISWTSFWEKLKFLLNPFGLIDLIGRPESPGGNPWARVSPKRAPCQMKSASLPSCLCYCSLNFLTVGSWVTSRALRTLLSWLNVPSSMLPGSATTSYLNGLVPSFLGPQTGSCCLRYNFAQLA